MLNKKHVSILVGIYALVRVFSFFFGPATPLQPEHWLNNIVSSVILITVIVLLLKKNPVGWYSIALELILGGVGNFLNIDGIALRTLFVPIALLIFFGQKIWDRQLAAYIKQEHRAFFIISLLVFIAVIGSFIGLGNHHATVLVISDLIPYAFVLYYFPLRELLRSERFTNLMWQAVVAAIIGSAFFTIGSLIAFSTHIVSLQDTFYHWFRDVAGGKATMLPFNYFRIVLNEQLLLVPVFLWAAAKVIAKERVALYSTLLGLMLAILATNLTRIYFVALAIGFLFLIREVSFKRWLAVASSIVAGFLAVLILFHTILSGGQSLGLELIGLRLQSIVTPSMEDSSLSRLLLLPKIEQKIAIHPIIGNGLGDTITVYSPVLGHMVTTPDYDWGYLEIIGELGMIGFLIWVIFLSFIILKAKRKKLAVWQVSSLAALLIVNLTSPALFHVLGLTWLSYLLAW